MKKVIIIGAGISGLTVAHELINKGFEVDIYEKNNIAGGMARSVRISNNIPTEHSWRGYGPFYYNAFHIMKQIPISDKCVLESFQNNREFTLEEVQQHTTEDSLWTIYKNEVYDITEFIDEHPGGRIIMSAGGKDLEQAWKDMGVNWHSNDSHVLQHLGKYKIGKLKSSESFIDKQKTQYSVYDNLGKEIYFKLFRDNLTLDDSRKIINTLDFRDIPFFMSKIIEFESSSTERRKVYFKQPLLDFIRQLHPKSQIFVRDFINGPGLGMDWNTASFGHFAIVVGFSIRNMSICYNINCGTYWRVMSKPTSEAWIEPWVSYLRKQGVKFHFNHQCHKINFQQNKISNIIILNNNNKTSNLLISGDEYIIATDPFTYQSILKNSSSQKNNFKNQLENLSKMNTINNQIGFVIGFNHKFKYKTPNDCFVLVDSSNNITFYPQDLHFCNNINLGKNIKSLWSGTCVISYQKGGLYNKSLTQLNIPELKKEILNQFMASKDLKYYIAKYNNGHQLTINDIETIEIFQDWEYNISTKRLKSKNSKWVNTYYNEEHRLDQQTEFENMYVVGAHTKTSINVWSMESAVESGKIASNYILEKYGLELTYLFIQRSSILFRIFQWLDILLYALGLPNFNLIHVIFMLIIFWIYLLYKKYQKKLKT